MSLFACDISKWRKDLLMKYLTIQRSHFSCNFFVDAPSMISLKVSTIDHHSLSLSWETEEEASITGYIMSYKSHLDNWEEVKTSGKKSKYILDNLRCGTKYQITAIAVNKAGRSKPSDVVSAATAGNGNVKWTFLSIWVSVFDLLVIVVSMMIILRMQRFCRCMKWGIGSSLG